jgi:MFS family permease
LDHTNLGRWQSAGGPFFPDSHSKFANGGSGIDIGGDWRWYRAIMSAAASHSRRSVLLACVMLALFIAAIEASIVAPAMPQIVAKLGGFALYSWVFAAFLLAQTVTTVLFGKLADMYGRKPVLIGGILAFLAGSLLSGFAWSMPSMIAFRLLQGLGAGSIQPVAITMIGDMYSPTERLKIQGWISAVWAIAAIAGPMVGGFIVQNFSWKWIFWVNIPVGLLSIAGFQLFMREQFERKPHALDYKGAGLFSLAVSALLLALTQSATFTWGELALLAAVFVAASAGFLMQEQRAAEPVVALDLWGERMIARANAALLLGTMTLIGVTSFLPVYMQAVQGRPAILAGIPLSAMLFAWPMASAVSWRLVKRLTMRGTMRAGAVLIPIGAAALLFITPATPPFMMGIGPALMGFGMGLLNITAMVMIQGSVEHAKRGSATASMLFARSLGSTLGVTALGAVLNLAVIYFASGHGNSLNPEQIQALLKNIGNMLGGAAAVPELRSALDYALRGTFWGMVGFSTVCAVTAFTVPVRELDTLSDSAPQDKSAAPARRETAALDA